MPLRELFNRFINTDEPNKEGLSKDVAGVINSLEKNRKKPVIVFSSDSLWRFRFDSSFGIVSRIFEVKVKDGTTDSGRFQITRIFINQGPGIVEKEVSTNSQSLKQLELALNDIIALK